MKAPAIMSTQAKREYVALKHTEYRRCVSRAQKHELIREVASTCDFSVKYVIRRLNHPLPTQKASSSRKKTYTQEDLFWLQSKQRDPLSGHTSQRYDKAKTPVQRLLDSGLLSERSRETLPKQASNTHLIALNRELFRLLKLAAAQGVEHAQPLVPAPLPSVHFFIEASREKEFEFAGWLFRSQNNAKMKNIFLILVAVALAGSVSGCLYSPDVTYTYWRYSSGTQMYSPIRTETPLTPEEIHEQGLVENLPENAKTTEAP